MRPSRLAVLPACALAGVLLMAGAHAAPGLGDTGFESLAGKDAPREAAPAAWAIPPGPPHANGIEVRGAKAYARAGEAGLRLHATTWGRLAAVRQGVLALAPGVYTFAGWARGEGVLARSAGSSRRRGDLTKEWAPYSITFAQAQEGPAELTILANSDAQVDDASLAPIVGERLAAWEAQEKARAEYGFVPEYLSTQLPQPGAPQKPAGAFQGGPLTFREKVVYYDERYDTAHLQHPEVLARYLAGAGFRQLDAPALGEWMRNTTAAGAYGTVCVMTHGICPASVWSDKPEESPIRKYLAAGGRLVWVGDVPFYYLQDETHPQIFSKGAYTTHTGVRGGWETGAWGNQTAAEVTPLGKAWGLGDAGASVIAAYPEDVTAVLSGFRSEYAGSDLAVTWLKSFSPLHPWSGFLFAHKSTDMLNPALQQSVYRLALYAGRPVEAPAGLRVQDTAAAPLRVTLDPPRNRRCYTRGESIPVSLDAAAAGAGALTLVLERDGKAFPRGSVAWPAKDTPARIGVKTADLACGDYRLRVRQGAGSDVWETTVTLCPRREDPTFFFGAWGASAGNPYRQDLILKDLAANAMHSGTATQHTPARLLDQSLKHGVCFALRADPGGTLTDQEREEALRRGPNGEKIPGAWEGGRPILGLLHPRLRQVRAESMAAEMQALCAWPAAWPRVDCNDDFSMYYGHDFSEVAKRTFKEKTGLDVPIPAEIAKLGQNLGDWGTINRPKGVVPDNDPWLQYSVFCTKDVGGGYNKALTEACVKAVPGIKVGPVPGNMQLPLWCHGQYPPHQFGANGFNLLMYYYYLCYWQPLIGNLYWDEIARMGNRGLELWSVPDCYNYDEPTYHANTFFLHLAGGCQGLSYYTYTEAKPGAWKELGRLGGTVVRPLGPFLGKLRPAPTSAGWLLPYTQWAHSWLYPTTAVYPFANLMGAHLDVQPTCEEEVLSGHAKGYGAILLWHVEWLRESVVRALEEHVARGGVVLADATTTVPIQGAIRLPVDLAMGDGKSNPDDKDPRFGGPGIRDYLHPDRVATIRKALEPYVKPWVDCDDPTLVARRHQYGGVNYLWLVNVHTREEYEYLRDRIAAGARPANPEQAKEEAFRYLAERAGKRFTARVTIPSGKWVAYDVLRGRRIPLEKAGGRLAFTADMERLGGTLVALYPAAVAKVLVQAPARMKRGAGAALKVSVLGAGGKPLAGTQPLQVEVLTPAGAWSEVTGAHATDAGVWTTQMKPAVNDPAGRWRVRVRELSSGTLGEAAVVVE